MNKFTILFCFFSFISCQSKTDLEDTSTSTGTYDSSIVDSSTARTAENTPPKVDELEGENEFIDQKLFNKWKGTYEYITDVSDANGRDSKRISRFYLIRPDSSVYEGWLTDEKLIRYTKDDYYLKITGGVQTNEKKEIIFLEKDSENPYQITIHSPVLILSKENNTYYIASELTNPPHSPDIMAFPIQKIK